GSVAADLPVFTAAEALIPTSVRRRRAAAQRSRQMRLWLIDMAVAALLAVVGLALAPGLAILALGALLVLAGCAVSVACASLRRRRASGRSWRPRRRGPSFQRSPPPSL